MQSYCYIFVLAWASNQSKVLDFATGTSNRRHTRIRSAIVDNCSIRKMTVLTHNYNCLMATIPIASRMMRTISTLSGVSKLLASFEVVLGSS